MTDTPTAEITDIDPEQEIVEFRHGLGCAVTVTAYDAAGHEVGYLPAVEIDADEVEIPVIPGSVARLVAVPAPPEDPDDV